MAKTVPFFGPNWDQSHATLFNLIGYKIYQDVVLDFHRSEAPYQIVSAPARTSKSYSSSPEAVHDFFPMLDAETKLPVKEENIVWLIGIDYDTIKEWDYCWQYLVDQKLVEKFGGVFEASHNQSRQGNLLIRVKWPFLTVDGKVCRSILQGKSTNSERTLQGEEVRTTIFSEAAEHDQRIFEKYIDQRSSRTIFPTTPKRKAMWLYEMIQLGLEDKSLGIDSFEFDRFCNPEYDHERYERAKARSIINYGSAENDPSFMEQFEGKWTFEGGKVLPFRWLECGDGLPTNVRKEDEQPEWLEYCTTYFVSIDYGFTDPAAALLWAVGPGGNLLILDEVYERNLTPGRFVELIHKMTEEHDVVPNYYVPDPMLPHVNDLMIRDHRLPVWDRMPSQEHRDRAVGFQELRDALEIDPMVGEARINVHERCKNLIHEMKNLRFKDDYTNEFSKAAIIGKDHAVDAARYGIRTRPVARSEDRDWVREFTKNADRRHRRAMMNGMRPERFVGNTPGLFRSAS